MRNEPVPFDPALWTVPENSELGEFGEGLKSPEVRKAVYLGMEEAVASEFKSLDVG